MMQEWLHLQVMTRLWDCGMLTQTNRSIRLQITLEWFQMWNSTQMELALLLAAQIERLRFLTTVPTDSCNTMMLTMIWLTQLLFILMVPIFYQLPMMVISRFGTWERAIFYIPLWDTLVQHHLEPSRLVVTTSALVAKILKWWYGERVYQAHRRRSFLEWAEQG